jgi:glycosyltransferase involved in cell wall biosynthesis
MRVGVAIVAYNRLECLQRCLHSIFRSESLSRIDSLAVFDDGSSYDLSAEIDFPESLCAKVFQSAANHGVIVNKNRALYYFAEIDPVDIVIILEDDVVVSDGDWLSSWVQSVEIHGHMNYSPGYFRIPEYKKFWLRPDSKGTPQDPFSYSVVTGQCTALSAELIRSKVGYLNPQFQGYGHGHVEWASRLVRLGYGGHWSDNLPRAFYAIRSGVEIQPAASNKNQKEIDRNKKIMDRLIANPDATFVQHPWLDDVSRDVFLSVFRTANIGVE